MDIRQVIQSQYGASLDMLKQAVERCPASLWDDGRYRNRCWHIAYHALFYTHLYLQRSERDFSPWARHREQCQFMFSFACRVSGGQLDLTDEAAACQYFDVQNIPPNTSPKQVERIRDALSAGGQPVFRRQTGPSTREMLQKWKS